MAGQLAGKIQTVTGIIDPADLGVTLPHEHLLIDINFTRLIPSEAGAKGRAGQPMTIENLWHIRRDWRNAADRNLSDEDEVIGEVLLYKRAGGNSIVDATPIGLGRDPLGLGRIARGSGVNVIMGCGYYTMEVPQPGLDDKPEATITAEIVHDIQEGFGWPSVRAGIIGEIGSTWPRHPNEEKSLRAAVAAQLQTGAPLLIHPGRNPRAPIEIIEIIKRAGGDPGRVIMSHLDRTVFDLDTLLELAGMGCYLEYDLFGQESSYYPYGPDLDMPNDAMRVNWLLRLMEHGYRDRLLVSHDLGNKWRLRKYGGHGYGHIIEDVVPVMLRKGMTPDDVEQILVRNPARALTFI